MQFYWRRQWQPTPVHLPGKSHGWRSLVGCSPWGCEESEMTEQLHFHFSFSCIGEGNGNPLQCSCLENPKDGGAWWAAVYGVAQSRTRLKRLNSSSSSSRMISDTEYLFMYLCTFVDLIWRKKSIQVHCPFLIGLFGFCFFFFAMKLYYFLLYFSYQLLIRYMVYRYFLPFYRLPFHFVIAYFSCIEAFDVV